MTKQNLTTAQERKMKMAEAGILITLVLALAIFVGVRVHSGGTGEAATATPAEQTVSITAEPGTEGTGDPEITVPETEECGETVAMVETGDVVEQEDTQDSPPTLPVMPVTYASAEKTFQAGDFESAAAMFSEYTDQHQDNAWGYYMLGLAEWKAGDPEAAEDAFLHALDLKPDHLKSLVNYGRVLIALDRNEEALARIETALAVNPASLDAIRVQGRIQHNLGRLDEAVASYNTVLAANPDDVWALNNLGLILIQQEKFQDALAPLAKASLIRGDVASIQNNLGIALERTGHPAAAGLAYARALENDRNHAKSAGNLARVESLGADQDPVPVDLAELAAGFNAGPQEEDMEVASTIASSVPVVDEPETDGSRNR